MGAALATPEPLPQELLVRIQAQAGELRQKKRRRQRWQRPTAYTKREDKVRDILQVLTRHDWPSCRPVWLENPKTGRCMELDGYCRALPGPGGGGCAFEADGEQHFGRVAFYHKKQGDYESQSTRDHIKDRLCEAAGVTLIRTPPRSHLCDSQLALYLCQQLAERRVLYTHSS